jgi:hypothetical protein
LIHKDLYGNKAGSAHMEKFLHHVSLTFFLPNMLGSPRPALGRGSPEVMDGSIRLIFFK